MLIPEKSCNSGLLLPHSGQCGHNALDEFFLLSPLLQGNPPDNLNPNHNRFGGGAVDWLPEEASGVNPVMGRIQRARALAAVHQLQAAATELENIRASVNDVTLRNVTTLMLLGIYLEDGNYGRSQSLLEETFANRK